MQIHLHRTAGPLQHQPTVGPSLLHGLEPFTDRLPARTEPVAVVMLRSGQANAGAAVYHLTGAIAPWLEQHGIHGTAGLQTGGPGLHRLGVRHLAAVGIHPGVVAHVLPLEGQRLFAAAVQHPAESCCHQGFAGSTGGPQHHQWPLAVQKGQRRRSTCRRRSFQPAGSSSSA